MFSKSEMTREEKIETMSNFIADMREYYEDNSHAPMDPHVYFNSETGTVGIHSALSVHGESDVQIGRLGDLYDWYSVSSFKPDEFSDDDLCAAWDQTYDAALESMNSDYEF